MTRVKICGCRTPEHALAAAEAGADFVGLMFAESRRQVTVEEAYEIVHALGTPLREIEMESAPALFRAPEDADLRSWYEHGATALDRLLARKRPLTVGVFAGQEPEEINDIVDECGVDLIQLSNGGPWSACLLANRQVIKVVHVGPEDTAATTLGRIEPGSAIAVLLDRADPSAFGGTGKAVDLSVAAEVARALPVWLAGGLTPESVAGAIEAVRPWAVDVSSGVETEGVKDVAKIRAFVAAAKGAAR
jgi:phosphoribosylanthranilate isomerase